VTTHGGASPVMIGRGSELRRFFQHVGNSVGELVPRHALTHSLLRVTLMSQ
jgi:hypothetical protein